MDNDTMIYIVMIIAGIILLVWYKGRSGKKPVPDSTPNPPPYIDPTPPPTELAKDINRIYIYSAAGDRMKRRVWVCRDCEVENSSESEYCILCGSSKTGGR